METSEVTDTSSQDTSEQAAEATEAATGAAQRAIEVVADAAGTARSAVESHAPAVLDVGRSTASAAYAQVRNAPDDQLAMGTAFAAGLVAGFILARVPRPLLVLALVPLAVLGGTLLGRKGPFGGRRKGRSRSSSS